MVAALAATVPLVPAASPAQAAPTDVYAFANGCYALKDESSGRFVTRDSLGFVASATSLAGATPFRMQATALGRYLFYGTGGHMLSIGLLNSIPSTTTPSVNADWQVADGGAGRLRISSVANGKGLGVGLLRRLGQSATVEARWTLQTGARLRDVPGDRGERHRHPAADGEPDGAGPGLPRLAHPRQRLPVPRRSLPLRASVEPLRRHRRARGLRRPRPER